MVAGVNVSGYDKSFAGYDGGNEIDDDARYRDNSDITADGRTTHPVEAMSPNELGLYAMSANV